MPAVPWLEASLALRQHQQQEKKRKWREDYIALKRRLWEIPIENQPEHARPKRTRSTSPDWAQNTDPADMGFPSTRSYSERPRGVRSWFLVVHRGVVIARH